MNKKEKEEFEHHLDIMDEVREAKAFLESKWYNVCFISVYGSQNYGLDIYTDEYKSDIDFKAVIVPTLKQLVDNSKPLSTTIEYWDGQIDIKDVRVFVPTLCKCNPAYIETLYSEYSIASPHFMKIIDERENLVNEMGALLLKACYGMIKEKEHAFSHPFPSIKDKIEKYGYDPKQLHHIVRLKLLMLNYSFWWKFDLGADKKWYKKFLLDIKIWKCSLKDAEELRDRYVLYSKEIIDNYDKPPVFDAKNRVMELSKELVYNEIIYEISNM